jgi:hypothetical protein
MEKTKFDIDFKLLPPELQLQLWILALDADTSKVALAYMPGKFRTNLSYNYGGNLEASLAVRRFKGSLGVNPHKPGMDLGLVYRGFKFGSSASFVDKSFGFSLNYGADLLPFPGELATTFNAAWAGLWNAGSNISAAPNNPLAWYNLHSDDVGAITKAVRAGQSIAKSRKNSQTFGAGLRLNFAPQTGLTIFGQVQYLF